MWSTGVSENMVVGGLELGSLIVNWKSRVELYLGRATGRNIKENILLF